MITNKIKFTGRNGEFCLENPDEVSGLYLPVAGERLKSAVTPAFGGDAKLDQNHFLMEPVSIENLHNNRSARAFWCRTEKGAWCVTSEGKAELEAGFMWQTVRRSSDLLGLSSEVTLFIPREEDTDGDEEVMTVRVTNDTQETVTFRPTAVIPLYGRSASNIRDHRDVTSMLNRAVTIPEGVVLKPTLSFDERGHLPNTVTYFVTGYAFTDPAQSEGVEPEDFYPAEAGCIGEGGSFSLPRSVLEDWKGLPAGMRVDGQEVTGGLHFPKTALQPGQTAQYVIVSGTLEDEKSADPAAAKTHKDSEDPVRMLIRKDNAPDTTAVRSRIRRYASGAYIEQIFRDTKAYWQEQVNVRFRTGSEEKDNFMRWVSFQPILRRIYGCSFLPHHDYGKGGRGWRDLWQDCLALLIMDPDGVRDLILSNFDGVRIDGTNATIIGERPGEFVADRNSITRVWMDHGYWPFGTVKLYIDQTGDLDILSENAGYFKDRQADRAEAVDDAWTPSYGTRQKTVDGEIYKGTVLEHLLLQNLCASLETGEHGLLRLRGADWNDALDMAEERGESAAFTAAYAGNLSDLADLIELYVHRTGKETLLLAEEMLILLEQEGDTPEAEVLEKYLHAVRHEISGLRREASAALVTEALRRRSAQLMQRMREQEWVTDGQGHGWFNSYYDNHGRQVEGNSDGNVRMMLTGQVFSIMSGTATPEQTEGIAKSADLYLYDRPAGGYRLNTNFNEVKTDLGRMFGFAYGEKENGAVFSHMTVMYANALYKRGFVREGYKALETLAETALNYSVSGIYPGIPEYFSSNVIRPAASAAQEITAAYDGTENSLPGAAAPGLSRMGRGRYHYLTGAASWYMLTMITQVFGVRGSTGDLLLEPKLLKEQFDENGNASVSCLFADRMIQVNYHNPAGLDGDSCRIQRVLIGGIPAAAEISDRQCLVKRDLLMNAAAPGTRIEIDVQLG